MESDGGMVFAPPKDRRPDALGDLKVLSDELLCAIFESLSPSDIGRLACVSIVLYIFCNEEPLWMGICLRRAGGLFEYRGTWKATTLCEYFGFLPGYVYPCRKPMCFDAERDKKCFENKFAASSVAFDDSNIKMNSLTFKLECAGRDIANGKN